MNKSTSIVDPKGPLSFRGPQTAYLNSPSKIYFDLLVHIE